MSLDVPEVALDTPEVVVAPNPPVNGTASHNYKTTVLNGIADAWVDYKATRSTEARNMLVEHYMPIVKYNAERLASKLPENVEVDDLIAEGVFGLLDALDGFDVNRGVRFETYCVPRIRGAMLDSLRKNDATPRLARAKEKKLNEAMMEFTSKNHHAPNHHDLATHLNMDDSQLMHLQKAARANTVISLHKKWFETDSYKDVREIDMLTDNKAESPSANMEKNAAFEELLKGLNPKEKQVMTGYYAEGMTMKQIGQAMNLSESRVSQMHTAILSSIRKKIGAHKGLGDYLDSLNRDAA